MNKIENDKRQSPIKRELYQSDSDIAINESDNNGASHCVNTDKCQIKSENITEKEISAINLVRKKIPDEETMYDLAELFKVFGDSTRARILCCLEVKNLYVSEIAEILNLSVSAVSHQLRILRNAKLVRGVKEGKEVRYSLDDNHVMMIIECGMSHVNEKD